MRILRHLAVGLAALSCTGCMVAGGLAGSVSSAVDCAATKKHATFYPEGAKRVIDISFELLHGSERLDFSGRVTCAYTGTHCGFGDWSHDWKGTSSDVKTANTPPETYPAAMPTRALAYWDLGSVGTLKYPELGPYNLCYGLEAYQEECRDADCKVTEDERFGFRLYVPPETEGGLRLAKRIAVADLPEYGLEVVFFEFEFQEMALHHLVWVPGAQQPRVGPGPGGRDERR